MKRARKNDTAPSIEKSATMNLPVHCGADRLFKLQRGKRPQAANNIKDIDKPKEKPGLAIDISRGDLHRRAQSLRHSADLGSEQLRAWMEALLAGLNIFIFGIGEKLSILHAFARCMDRSDVYLIERAGSVRDLLDAVVIHPLRRTPSDMRCKDLSLFNYAHEVLRTYYESLQRCC